MAEMFGNVITPHVVSRSRKAISQLMLPHLIEFKQNKQMFHLF
jgi:hypothetical protein